MAKEYDYSTAGYDAFLTRSIDADVSDTLVQSGETNSTRELNYDQSQTTGSLGSVLRIGNIQLDGQSGRISIFDDNANEVVRLGELDD